MKSKLAMWSLILPIVSIVVFGGTNILLEKGHLSCGGVHGTENDTLLCKFSTKNPDFGGMVAIFNLSLTLLSLIFGIAAIKVIKRNLGFTGKSLAIIGIILSTGLSLFWFFVSFIAPYLVYR